MTHVLVLMYLGNPDIGLIATTYFGYWIAGAVLLSAGMLASQFTNNMTGAFVLGMVITAILVFIGQVARFIGLGNRLDGFSLEEQFRDLGMGIIPLTSLDLLRRLHRSDALPELGHDVASSLEKWRRKNARAIHCPRSA